MKRHYAMGGAILFVLSGLVAACSGNLLESADDSYENPYLTEGRTLVTTLVKSAVEYTANARQRGPLHSDRGELLLEALGSAPGVDIDVPKLNALLTAGGASGKAKPGDPFPGETTLSSVQKEHLDRALDRAAKATDLASLGSTLAAIDRSAVRDLGQEAAKPILVVTAGLYAEYEYFTDPENAGMVRRLIAQIRQVPVVGEVTSRSAAGVRMLRVQDTGDRPRNDPPPFWGQFFNPGDWWLDTVSDTREAAQLGVLAGAGVGCVVGSLPTAGAGCGPGGAAGGLMGGLLGVIVGGVASAIANYQQALHDFSVAETQWCESQRALMSILRDKRFAAVCDKTQE
jgi:hypothetical protein